MIYPLVSLRRHDSKLLKSPNILDLRIKINDFWIARLSNGQFDHGESENHASEDLG